MPHIMGGGSVPLIGRRAGALAAGDAVPELVTGITSLGSTSNGSASSGQYAWGWEFTSSEDVDCYGGRIYLGGNYAGMAIVLWDVSTESPLASVDGLDGRGQEWVEAMFEAPVALTSGTAYVVTVWRAGTAWSSYYAGVPTLDPRLSFVRRRKGGSVSSPTATFPVNTESVGTQIRGIADLLLPAA